MDFGENAGVGLAPLHDRELKLIEARPRCHGLLPWSPSRLWGPPFSGTPPDLATVYVHEAELGLQLLFHPDCCRREPGSIRPLSPCLPSQEPAWASMAS
jgi:hypothetical protein